MAYNKKGWKSESARHSLAAKGIKTGRKGRNGLVGGDIITLQGKKHIVVEQDVTITSEMEDKQLEKLEKQLNKLKIIKYAVKEFQKGGILKPRIMIVATKYLQPVETFGKEE